MSSIKRLRESDTRASRRKKRKKRKQTKKGCACKNANCSKPRICASCETQHEHHVFFFEGKEFATCNAAKIMKIRASLPVHQAHCNKCGILPIAQFDMIKSGDRKGKPTTYCRVCLKVLSKQQCNKKNPPDTIIVSNLQVELHNCNGKSICKGTGNGEMFETKQSSSTSTSSTQMITRICNSKRHSCGCCLKLLPNESFGLKLNQERQSYCIACRTRRNTFNRKGDRLINCRKDSAIKRSKKDPQVKQYLTKNEIKRIFVAQDEKCEECHCQIYIDTAKGPSCFSIDRINNRVTYLQGNVQLTCMICQRGRNLWSKDEWQLFLSFYFGYCSQLLHAHVSNWPKGLNTYLGMGGHIWYHAQFEKQNGVSFYNPLIKLCPCNVERCPFRPSIQRLDNSKGHTVENCVLVTIFENYARNRIPLPEYHREMAHRKETWLAHQTR